MAANSLPLGPVFTPEQAEANRRAQRLVHDIFPLLDKAERCGIPVDALRTLAAGLQQQLVAIESEFMKNL